MSETKKSATIFDFIDGVTSKKKEWSNWSDPDQKKFAPFIVNRWLSMRMELTEFINDLQKYTIGLLRPSETYRLYYEFLPQQKSYAKYIKGKASNKYEKELVMQIADHYQVSHSEAIDYIELMDWDSCDFLLSKYGISIADRKKLLKGVKQK